MRPLTTCGRVCDVSVRAQTTKEQGEIGALQPSHSGPERIEIERGQFRRVIELGAEVRGEEAKAAYEDGMLRIELPLVREAEARPVPISRADEPA